MHLKCNDDFWYMHLYLQYHERYVYKALSDEAPHVFAIVDKAWQAMLHHKEHQNIILSGDRNSGKSFNFNQIIRHLCFMAKVFELSLTTFSLSSDQWCFQGNAATANRIEQLPAILDCFGNAATEGNANSTRHVRYLELTFTESGKLSGAIITLYLLEKWRICESLSKLVDQLCNKSHEWNSCPNKYCFRSNRNFHIFYYVYYGLKKEGGLKSYFLDGRSQYRFLPVGESDAELSFYLNGYLKLKEYLRCWDMENQEQEFIFQTIAAILLIGEIDFDGDDENASVLNSDILNKGTHLLPMIRNRNNETIIFFLSLAATLLNVSPSKLGWALCNKSTIVHGTSEVTGNSVVEAQDYRDALARGIYSRLVDWLVNNLNINLCLSRKVL